MRTKPGIQRDLLGAAILQVRGGRAVSRSSLANTLGLAPSTAGLYVDQLIEDGYVVEAGLERGTVGRPKRTLSPRPGAGWFAGIEFNAERVQAVRVDFSGRLVATQVKRLPADGDARAVLQTVNATIAQLAKGVEEPLLAIGVGAPGVVEPSTGISDSYAFIEGWKRVPVAETVRRKFGPCVRVENNLRAIALAERWFGGGRHLSDYVILGPRSGLGVAVVQGGHVLRGAHHAAGEIGHWLWDGQPEGAGSAELQGLLSAPAVWRRLAQVSDRARLPDDLRAALAPFGVEGGAEWDAIVSDYARITGCLQLLLDTHVFFLHGPLTALGSRFCTAIERRARETFPTLADGEFRIVPSELGDNAGALGAASLAMEAWAPKANGETCGKSVVQRRR